MAISIKTAYFELDIKKQEKLSFRIIEGGGDR